MNPPKAGSFAGLVRELTGSIDRLASRRLLLFGGKGGVGKTTLASLAALHLARSRPVILLSTDPASNLGDVFSGSPFSAPGPGPGPDFRRSTKKPGTGTGAGTGPGNLSVRSLDADELWRSFLDENLESFVKLGDRGTYLDREEIRSLFQLSVPGIDELMGWLEIGAVAEENPGATVVVDTAPTGHTLRLLSSSRHFEHLAAALEEMQAKHRALVTQLTRRRATDALDAFLGDFRARFERRAAILSDAQATAFVPVVLPEPIVAAQTARLAVAVEAVPIAIPFAILNQAAHSCDCASCRARRASEEEAARSLNREVVRAPRACVPLGSVDTLTRYLDGEDQRTDGTAAPRGRATRLRIDPMPRLLFVAGKGGVGKTSVASSIALQLAARGRRAVLLSVDPAHSVRDLFPGDTVADIAGPENGACCAPLKAPLRVETIDTRAKWKRLRDRLGDEIERAVSGLTAPNLSIAHDSEVLRELVEIAPPGADEIFAVMRLADLLDDDAVDVTVVDTAPTGHFLRLLELPRTAGAWAREMMRLLLRYKELVPPGSLAAELTSASRDLRKIEGALGSSDAAALVVMRAEPLVAAETLRLVAALGARGLRIAGTIVNAMTPESGCSCDASRRAAELEIATEVAGSPVFIDRLPSPPVDLDSLRGLIPLE